MEPRDFRLHPAQERFLESPGKFAWGVDPGAKHKHDHYLDGFRYAFLMHHWRTVRRPSWLHPIKRVLWVHRHGPHVPSIREEIPPGFARLKHLS